MPAEHIEREEYFSALEFGVTPRFGETGAGAYHVTLWHIDERRRTNVEEGRGIALTMEQELGPSGNFVPFFRYSYADGGGTAIRQTVSVGAGIEEAFGQNSDLIGLGFSWGEPTNRALKDQYVFEAFYRFNITPYTHLTPDVQLILHPAENPDDDRILIGSLRLRTIF